jgi:glycosyltransferase involved in cell wall biosynthesis
VKRISIVIPCYNHGKFIRETLESLKSLPQDIYELIIMNDGSTDEYTIQVLAELTEQGYNILHQPNQGLSKTRNNLIQLAACEYILPLDSDNKIRPEYVTKSIEILDQYQDVSVVYGDRMLFGDVSGYQTIGPFNLQKLMLYNYIDACAVFRKKAWENVGGYDEEMKLGVEDWEFWLRLAFKGHTFYYVPEVLFDYRVLGDSMARTTTGAHLGKIKSYMQAKHPEYLGFTIVEDYINDRFKRKPLAFLLKQILRAWFPNTYRNLQSKGKIQDS